jgi:hypothetical protein
MEVRAVWISAILFAVCMVLIAGSGVLCLRVGFTGPNPLLAGLALLTAFAVYNAMAARERAQVSEQLSAPSRGSGDQAGQLAE